MIPVDKIPEQACDGWHIDDCRHQESPAIYFDKLIQSNF